MLTLYIGNKNYSSWSMRVWLVVRHFNIVCNEYLIPFDDFNIDRQFKQKVLKINPAGKVPVLVDDGLLIWDSLAICEYLADKFPEKQMWPKELKQRARARSMSAEMHSSFTTLRSMCAMNVNTDLKHIGIKIWQENIQLQQDVQRIEQLWRERPNENSFLCGDDFNIVDAFYAPIVIRFIGYGLPISENSQIYLNKIYNLPTIQQWINEAKNEVDFLECGEQY